MTTNDLVQQVHVVLSTGQMVTMGLAVGALIVIATVATDRARNPNNCQAFSSGGTD